MISERTYTQTTKQKTINQTNVRHSFYKTTINSLLCLAFIFSFPDWNLSIARKWQISFLSLFSISLCCWCCRRRRPRQCEERKLFERLLRRRCRCAQVNKSTRRWNLRRRMKAIRRATYWAPQASGNQLTRFPLLFLFVLVYFRLLL